MGRKRCLPAMAGEVLSYVQGESLKGNAVVRDGFLNSPVTSNAGDRFTAGELAPMEHLPPYSLWADWLSKFHTWPNRSRRSGSSPGA